MFFYNINTDLTPDVESIRQTGNIGVFLHMGYYGFYTNRHLDKVIRNFKEQSTIVAEDITHTLFSNFVHTSRNDYCFASLRKWMGLPSGGFYHPQKEI